MEVKIGVQNVAREIVFESDQSPEDVTDAVTKCLEKSQPLTLEDERGRRIVVPIGVLAYVEIGAEESRRVGFGAL